MASTLKILYSFATPNKRGKERFETILEPLQAIIQIGCLSFYPVGTKIAIKHNMLVIQPPNYTQSMSRWYNNDTQDDLCYLFNVFSRFKRFYTFMETDNAALYALLVANARAGIDKLIRTYSDTNKPHILHTLSMYKTMIGNQQQLGQPPGAIEPYYDEDAMAVSTPIKKKSGAATGGGGGPTSTELTDALSASSAAAADGGATSNIDSVFSRIVDKYNPQIFIIIYNVLLQLQRRADDTGNGDNYLHYVTGLNQILFPINASIKKWIDENIVF
jgi:hypothetical protein